MNVEQKLLNIAAGIPCYVSMGRICEIANMSPRSVVNLLHQVGAKASLQIEEVLYFDAKVLDAVLEVSRALAAEKRQQEAEAN